MQSIFTRFLEGKILRDTTITEKPHHFIQFNNVFESHTTRQNIFVFMERNIHVKLISKRKNLIAVQVPNYVVNMFLLLLYHIKCQSYQHNKVKL